MARIPSIQALRALESFARLGTVWQAAEDLNVTRSAVSHQLRLLEQDLGFPLYTRIGTRIELTGRGRAYASDVRRALAVISASASRNAGRGLSGQLTVSCTPGFAAAWLSTKVGRFRSICPDVQLSIITPRRLDDVSNPDADLFIAFGTGSFPGGEAELLKEVEFTPLISPVLLNRLGGMKDHADVQRGDLLHLVNRSDWLEWLRIAGLSEDLAAGGVTFSDMNLVYSAAMSAQGIAMGDGFICREAMEGGQLVRPFDLGIRSPKSYYLVIPQEKAGIPAVTEFRAWIRDALP